MTTQSCKVNIYFEKYIYPSEPLVVYKRKHGSPCVVLEEIYKAYKKLKGSDKLSSIRPHYSIILELYRNFQYTPIKHDAFWVYEMFINPEWKLDGKVYVKPGIVCCERTSIAELCLNSTMILTRGECIRGEYY